MNSVNNTLIEQLRQCKNNWLLGSDCQKFLFLTEILYQKFANPVPQKILLAEPNPIHFLASLIAACSNHHQVFLGNPTWGSSEWQQVFELVKPNLVWGDCQLAQEYYLYSDSIQPDCQNCLTHQANSLIMIPTGGSSGKIRFAMHTWQTLIASVQGFREYFQLHKVNSICVLPLYHVSGLMQFVRSFSSGGQLLILPFPELKTGKLSNFDPRAFFISLVPTQLQYLLSQPHLIQWLSQCQTVLLGGAPAWPALLEQARSHNIKLAPCYGMTETASQIATLKPEDFLDGNDSSGQILPHAKVTICNEKGEHLGAHQIGQIVIESSSVTLGYYPKRFPQPGIFFPDDLGFLDSQGYLNIIGRSSDKIITGGENVFPGEVEAAIRTTGLVTDVAILGIEDNYWGQMITALYVPQNPDISAQQIQQAIDGQLARFKMPKSWIPMHELPRNEQGKINRKKIQELILPIHDF